jgi:protein tyrosine/serine phosphatase
MTDTPEAKPFNKSSVRAGVVALVLIASAAAGYGIYEYVQYRHDDFKPVVEGVLYRSCQPESRMPGMLHDHGIRTVVDLRTEAEDPRAFANEKACCEQANVVFINIPISDVLPSDDQIAKFLCLVQQGPRPVLVHCQYGKSRTGILSAAYRIVVQGWPAEKAMDEMVSYKYKRSDKDHALRVALLERLQKDRAAWQAKIASPASEPASRP